MSGTTPFEARVRSVRARLGDRDAALVSHIVNVRYLSGFTGSSGLFLITPRGDHLVVDFRYIEQARTECGCEVTLREAPFDRHVRSWIRGARRCAVEAQHVSLEMWDRLRAAGGDGQETVSWEPVKSLVEPVRVVKDETEIHKLEAAAELLEELMRRTIEEVRPGRTELEVAIAFEAMARRATARPLPFEPIIASGPRSALPHGVSSRREIRKGEFVVIDIGVNLDGYVSDMTRTVSAGPADARMREVHQAVHLANRTAARGIRPGMTGGDAHNLAAGVLDAAGLGAHFGHGLGHGIGVEVHEEPRLSPDVAERLEPGMVFTVEPGAYIPEWGGVRIEDSGVLEEKGWRSFHRLERSLLEIA